jgi:hypothetical protein
VDFNGGNQSSDAGLLLLREAERKLGLCRRLAAAIPTASCMAIFEIVMVDFEAHAFTAFIRPK